MRSVVDIAPNEIDGVRDAVETDEDADAIDELEDDGRLYRDIGRGF